MKFFKKVSVLFIIMMFLVSCATSWQNKMVTGYEIAGTGIKNIDEGFQKMKAQGIVTPAQITDYNKLYKQVYDVYILAGDNMKLAVKASDDIVSKKYSDLYKTNIDEFFSLMSKIQAYIKGLRR